MITFSRGGVQFSYRVVGVALRDGYILLHRAEKDDFWALPGGRCKLMEPSPDALRREMQEEMGVEVRVERLLWIVENFYHWQGIDFHELALFFLMDLGPGFAHYDPHKPFTGDEEGLRLIFRWFPVDGLKDVRLYPTFLRESLKAIPASTEHVVHTDLE